MRIHCPNMTKNMRYPWMNDQFVRSQLFYDRNTRTTDSPDPQKAVSIPFSDSDTVSDALKELTSCESKKSSGSAPGVFAVIGNNRAYHTSLFLANHAIRLANQSACTVLNIDQHPDCATGSLRCSNRGYVWKDGRNECTYQAFDIKSADQKVRWRQNAASVPMTQPNANGETILDGFVKKLNDFANPAQVTISNNLYVTIDPDVLFERRTLYEPGVLQIKDLCQMIKALRDKVAVGSINVIGVDVIGLPTHRINMDSTPYIQDACLIILMLLRAVNGLPITSDMIESPSREVLRAEPDAGSLRF